VLINIKVKKLITLFCCLISLLSYSQDSTCLKVHFLYGSKPLKNYKDTEQKSFGGILGGHVGIEGDSGKIVNFLPIGKFHIFAKNKNKHSTYLVHSIENFYSILGGNVDSVKMAIVYIPVSSQVKQTFDSLTTAYLKETPYDYAFVGMRCGAAAYDILGKIGVMPKYNYSKTIKKIFYPKKLRKKLFAKAKQNGWKIITQNGSTKRKWEMD
jgi:hypothetical protein